MFVAVYPELSWDPLDKKYLPRNYWNLHQNQERFINMCQYLFNINSYQDWYRLSQDQISQTRYPEQEWDIVSFSQRGKKIKAVVVGNKNP